MATIFFIILCLMAFIGIMDIIFDFLKWQIKAIIAIILIIASVVLSVKLIFAMIPLMFAISVASVAIGIIWAIHAIKKKVAK